VKEDQIDGSKIGPKLWLVKDDGCYLMSNAAGQKFEDNGPLLVSYAQGFDRDCGYELLTEELGGDDFVEIISIDKFERLLQGNPPLLSLSSRLKISKFAQCLVYRDWSEYRGAATLHAVNRGFHDWRSHPFNSPPPAKRAWSGIIPAVKKTSKSRSGKF
jgi:hypothetical protein